MCNSLIKYKLHWSMSSKNINPLVAQQVALDDALVALDDRAVINKCNMRIDSSKTQKGSTYQVVLDTLKLSPCYNAFLITIDVPDIYVHQFWFTISKIKETSSYQFKLDKKKFKIGVEVFLKILHICPRLPNQEFLNHLLMKKLSHSSKKLVIEENWNLSLSYVDQLLLSRAQILWGMYYKKNVDFVELFWKDIIYHIDNRQTTAARHSSMPYPKFTKAIIQHFISKYKTISMRNNLFMHGIKKVMETKAYKTYLAFANGNSIPKKARKRATAHINPVKESSLTADDNIISEDPNAALELAKSISKTEAKIAEETRLVNKLMNVWSLKSLLGEEGRLALPSDICLL
ncbi:hypothetical protein Tco_0077131 [Tanacetum coccineum]